MLAMQEKVSVSSRLREALDNSVGSGEPGVCCRGLRTALPGRVDECAQKGTAATGSVGSAKEAVVNTNV